MGLAELEANIRKDSGTEITQIKKEGEKRLKEIRDEYNAEADKIATEISSKGKRDAFLLGKKIVTQAKIEAQRSITDEKNKVINRVFARCRERILKLPDKKKSDIMGKLLGDSSMIDGTVTVHLDKKYEDMVKPWEGLSVKPDQIGDFGAIIESADGKIRIDNRLESVFEDMKGRVNPRLNKILFE